MTEIWKPVKDFRGYFISNYGQIRRGAKVINDYLTGDGYRRVALYRDGKKIYKFTHHLVADAFIPNEEGKLYVCHKDGNHSNNRVDNLTRDTKTTMSWKNDTKRVEAARKRAVCMGFANMKPVRNLDTNEVFDSVKLASVKYGIAPQGIGACANGYYKTCGGYHWEYVNKSDEV